MSNPRHIAIIMDGNGRWARARGYPRLVGHKVGMETLHKIVNHAGNIGIEWLTVFAFSSENWQRPADEVLHLMGLLKLFIKRDLDELHQKNVRVRVIGKRQGLPSDITKLLDYAETLTVNNTGLNFVVAFNYGGREELIQGFKQLAHQLVEGHIKIEDINEDVIKNHLYTAHVPDPDLIIRTSGEKRLSNFLLWQSAYSELYFSQCFWPEFDEQEFDKAIADYRSRQRRFGLVDSCEIEIDCENHVHKL